MFKSIESRFKNVDVVHCKSDQSENLSIKFFKFHSKYCLLLAGRRQLATK